MLNAENEKRLKPGQTTVLLVDDDDDVRAILRIFFEHLGYGVFAAENGFCALAVYKEFQKEIALVVLDWMMPHMDGLTLFRRLQQWNPQVKCIMISDSSPTAAVKTAQDEGLLGFLQKPLALNTLIRYLETISVDVLIPGDQIRIAG